MLIDSQLLQQLLAHVRAVRGAIGLQLRLIRPAEFAGGDLVSLDVRNRVAGRRIGAAAAQEVGDVEEDERHAHEAEAPLEPIPVLAHPIEHGHRGTLKP